MLTVLSLNKINHSNHWILVIMCRLNSVWQSCTV